LLNFRANPLHRIFAVKNRQRPFTKITNSHRVERLIMAAFAISVAIAVIPSLRSAPPVTPPTFTQTNLVSDVDGMAKTTDPNLVNPWGMSLGVNSGIWISNNRSGTATTYDGAGKAIPSGMPLAVTIPAPGNSGGKSSPTGVTTNDTLGFVISLNGKTGPSTQLFATEDGTIAGWNSSVDPTNAVIAVNNSTAGAVYKGLAMGFNATGALLFATNFHAGTVDVFDPKFQLVHTPGGFNDPNSRTATPHSVSRISMACCT
jgi:uncharacterized protein (TIGR03118 family)